MDISKHLREEQRFSAIANTLNVVLDKSKDTSKIDSNDVYDLIYCKKMLEKLIADTIENKDILANSKDLISRIDIILDSLDSSKLNIVLANDLKSVSKVNKAKYGKRNKYRELKYNGSKTDRVLENSVADYFKRQFPGLVTIGILLIMIKVFPGIINVITEDINTASTSITRTATEIEYLSALTDGISVLLRIACTAIIAFKSLQLCIDLIYITIPSFRDMKELRGSKDTFVSQEAKTAIQHEGYITREHILNADSRLEVAETLLNNCIDYVNNCKDCIKTYSVEITSDTHRQLDRLNNIRDELQVIKGRTLMSNTLGRIEAFVDAEILYNDVVGSIENEKKIHDMLYKEFRDGGYAV